MKLSEHFDSTEFQCKCCGTLPKSGVNKNLIKLLEDIRNKVEKSITITSGYRCESHNHKCGGKPKSQHLLGIAADINITGLTPHEVQDFLVTNFDDRIGGLGIYATFTHVDVRNSHARWKG